MDKWSKMVQITREMQYIMKHDTFYWCITTHKCLQLPKECINGSLKLALGDLNATEMRLS